jgi:hypothetical protein
MTFLGGFIILIIGLALVVNAYISFVSDNPTIEKCKDILEKLREAKYKFTEFENRLNDIRNGKHCQPNYPDLT